ncbi:MAG TPA: hypothetical protein VMW19_18405 [Myxococcota bacterium]|nr:hypothetical protein [Myxococcota bacterium]
MRTAMKHGRAFIFGARLLLASVCSLLLVGAGEPREPSTGPGNDLRCSTWNRLTDDQKFEAVDGLIGDAFRSAPSQRYPYLNRTRIQRCLEPYRAQLVDDFEELCARGQRADLQAMNRTLRNYTWSCLQ